MSCAGELVPMLTLNKFNTEEEEWTTWEKMQIVGKSLMGTEFGNNNPALWRIGPANLEEGVYMAVTDSKVPTMSTIWLTMSTIWLTMSRCRRGSTSRTCPPSGRNIRTPTR